MSLEIFQIVDTNPNDRIGGGGCVCSPGQKVSSCKGPFVVFDRVEVAGDPDAGIHNSPNCVVSLACATAAARAGGGEVLSTADTVGNADTPDLDFHDLPEDEQQALVDQFPKGGLTKLLSGKRVNVPPSAAIEAVLVGGGGDPTQSLEDLLGPAETPPLEEPGTAPNSFVPAEPPTESEPSELTP